MQESNSSGRQDDLTPVPTAQLYERLDPESAARILRGTYGDHAPAEALARALACERLHQRAAARFWLSLYEPLLGPLARSGAKTLPK